MRKGQKHSEEARRLIGDASRGKPSPNKGRKYSPYGCNVQSKRREIERHAIQRGLRWELTEDETCLLILGDCRYCGKASKAAEDRATVQNTRGLNGIDRVDSLLGYVPGNVVSCCGRCNSGKLTDSHEEFASWVRLVHSRLQDHEGLSEYVHPLNQRAPRPATANCSG